jgi:hypothetical protein
MDGTEATGMVITVGEVGEVSGDHQRTPVSLLWLRLLSVLQVWLLPHTTVIITTGIIPIIGITGTTGTTAVTGTTGLTDTTGTTATGDTLGTIIATGAERSQR